MALKILVGLVIAQCLHAAAPALVTRVPSKNYRTEGLFEGGRAVPANIESIRVSGHPEFERWVVDFSDALGRTLGKVAPQFQVRYVRGEKLIGPLGENVFARPAKFILTFRQVKQNYLDVAQLKRLVKKSRYVQDITIYPPIEDGDTAIELTLKDNVAFEAHQPVQKEGRLVLDLQAAPATP